MHDLFPLNAVEGTQNEMPQFLVVGWFGGTHLHSGVAQALRTMVASSDVAGAGGWRLEVHSQCVVNSLTYEK